RKHSEYYAKRETEAPDDCLSLKNSAATTTTALCLFIANMTTVSHP
ncbi:13886_t:CDS:1, partial [Entrophospora sp. SA101]